MGNFTFDLPDDTIKQVEDMIKNSKQMAGEMTRAGAEVVYNALRSNVPASFKDSDIMRCLKLTKTYNTPSDGGINTSVGFYGYFINKEGRLTPAPLVCNQFEYGRSSSPYPKYRFLKKSMNKDAIESAMLKKQSEYLGGIE